MGFLQSIVGVVRRVGQAMKDVYDLDRQLPAKVQENFSEFQSVFATDWARRTTEERQAQVESIKRRVRHELIPAAGQLSILGAPGILVYTPCQVAGGLAIMHVYQPSDAPLFDRIKVVASLMIWGKIGQITWIALTKLLVELLPTPLIGAGVIPYVQAWTETALDAVDSHYRNLAVSTEEPVQPESMETLPVLTEAEARTSPTMAKAKRLRDKLAEGGKLLFSAQKEVMRELVDRESGNSVAKLGETHLVRGVAGSGKTILLAQLVPLLAQEFHRRYRRLPVIAVYHHNDYLQRLLDQEILDAIKAPLLPTSQLSVSPYRRVQYYNREKLRSDARQDLRVDVVLADEAQDIDDDQLVLLKQLCLPDGTTGKPSLYVFYDDMQSIIEQREPVPARFRGDSLTQHFLTRSVRSSKLIVDLAVNTCLGPSVPLQDRTRLAHALGIEELKTRDLLVEEPDGWKDCRFCVFPGHVAPDVQGFGSDDEAIQFLGQQLDQLYSEADVDESLRGGVLVLCFNNEMVGLVTDHLRERRSLGEVVQRRSGKDIRPGVKLKTLAVEPGRINVANVWDAKGYDADIVYVLNPDVEGGTPLQKRARFYVAATRAKQLLAVYGGRRAGASVLGDALAAAAQQRKMQGDS